jgi:hypothetical protein
LVLAACLSRCRSAAGSHCRCPARSIPQCFVRRATAACGTTYLSPHSQTSPPDPPPLLLPLGDVVRRLRDGARELSDENRHVGNKNRRLALENQRLAKDNQRGKSAAGVGAGTGESAGIGPLDALFTPGELDALLVGRVAKRAGVSLCTAAYAQAHRAHSAGRGIGQVSARRDAECKLAVMQQQPSNIKEVFQQHAGFAIDTRLSTLSSGPYLLSADS